MTTIAPCYRSARLIVVVGRVPTSYVKTVVTIMQTLCV